MAIHPTQQRDVVTLISQEIGCNFNHYNQVRYEEQRDSETKNFQDATTSKISAYMAQWQTNVLKNRCGNVTAITTHAPFSSTSQVLFRAPFSPAQ